MNRKPCGRDLTLSSAMALAMVLLAGLYLVALAPLEKRLARLAELARELGEPAAPVTERAVLR